MPVCRFETGAYWLSFINVPLFFQDLQDPNSRGRMQPLVLSGLAMAVLMKSSELELGSRGRDLALKLRDRAQVCLEQACHSQDLDYTLAEAALVSIFVSRRLLPPSPVHAGFQILALFESSSHPLHSPEHACNALQLLDRIIHVLSLCSMDRDDPFVSSFLPRDVPIVYMPDGYLRPSRCSCLLYTPAQHPSPMDPLVVTASCDAPWDDNASETNIRKEECRRLCWTALTLVSAYTANCSAFHMEPIELSLAEPSNVRDRTYVRPIMPC